jgi:hypothetical protein
MPSIECKWRRFSEIENRNILDRHHPLNEIKVSISVGNMVGIWRSTARSSQVSIGLANQEAVRLADTKQTVSKSRSVRAAIHAAHAQHPAKHLGSSHAVSGQWWETSHATTMNVRAMAGARVGKCPGNCR